MGVGGLGGGGALPALVLTLVSTYQLYTAWVTLVLLLVSCYCW